ESLRTLGAQVVTCRDGISTLARARAEAFDLLLLDCRMPGGGALQILPPLRRSGEARSSRSFAVASSAELSPSDRATLFAAGFDDVLLKPCSGAELQHLLQQLPNHAAILLDDHAALAACGDATTMRALRGLLRNELEILEPELDALRLDADAFADRLHRLRSSCGFCGADGLSDQVVALQRQLAQRPTDIKDALLRFKQVLASTLHALSH
ncbi:MAG: response regulator, partial [Rhodanobacter sp.]